MVYWDYYEANSDCPPAFFGQDFIEESRAALRDVGCTPDQIRRLTTSGFVAIGDQAILIDRFYGGYLSSTDGRTRFPLSYDTIEAIIAEATDDRGGFPLFVASSPEDVRSIVSEIESESHQSLVFRGQVNHYDLVRGVRNPAFHHPMLGETSLIPSVWRSLLERHPICLGDFVGWHLFEWSKVLYSSFDIDAVDAAIEASGENPGLMSIDDMADHPDPVVSEFGQFRRALNLDYNFNLATALHTLLQHYGLLSPVLDVSRDIETAMFFATHRYDRSNNLAAYTPVGSNQGASIIYVLRFNRREMEPDARDFVLEKLSPLRPERQSCVVVRSSPFAVNLPADFLVGAIRLTGDGPWKLPIDQRHLFPDDGQDQFLKALKVHPIALHHLTDFYPAKLQATKVKKSNPRRRRKN